MAARRIRGVRVTREIASGRASSDRRRRPTLLPRRRSINHFLIQALVIPFDAVIFEEFRERIVSRDSADARML